MSTHINVSKMGLVFDGERRLSSCPCSFFVCILFNKFQLHLKLLSQIQMATCDIFNFTLSKINVVRVICLPLQVTIGMLAS